MKRLVVAAAVLAGALVMSPGTAKAASGDQVAAVTWNMCGAAAGCTYPGRTGARTSALVAALKPKDPAVIMLQEACYSQYRAILSRLKPKGYYGVFTPRYSRTRKCGGAYGQAILMKVRGKVTVHSLGGTSRYSKRGARYNLLKVTTKNLTVAVVHYRVNCRPYVSRSVCARDVNLAQRMHVKRTMAVLPMDRPTVLGGDFNLRPYRVELRPIRARMISDDRLGTYCKAPRGKLDYVWYSKHFTGLDSKVSNCHGAGVSDHRILSASARLR